ncbi:hypothetical protein CALCODRAFT_491640 [Calocera cornea HHB12733]|uniref:Uncharacterized protein n=1 Tax=Calocera cornea HHB12733 TaxID=1353952 RepID=A0A165IUL1_9BASI|nr:hypothetical protein CALCODRAFT_491640 [Calocera cornea HHB12733]
MPTLTALSRSQSQLWHKTDQTRAGMYRIVNGKRYRCKVSHRNAEDNKPGAGKDWEDYWEEV